MRLSDTFGRKIFAFACGMIFAAHEQAHEPSTMSIGSRFAGTVFLDRQIRNVLRFPNWDFGGPLGMPTLPFLLFLWRAPPWAIS